MIGTTYLNIHYYQIWDANRHSNIKVGIIHKNWLLALKRAYTIIHEFNNDMALLSNGTEEIGSYENYE